MPAKSFKWDSPARATQKTAAPISLLSLFGSRLENFGLAIRWRAWDSSPLTQKTDNMAKAAQAEVDILRLHEKDTGSADVQVALLTKRINELTGHLKANAKDHSSRRGLLKLVATRRRLLDYLKRTAADRYQSVLEKLQLRK